ncbi:MAG: DUF2089 domain-containing protein [Candidatus Eisenbacteria bacterium]|nr:DUF2089 domain-containing protein [Candidatus Eisenbacteria bacterium]
MRVPERCPSCSASLSVTGLCCETCGTQVQGRYEPCRFCTLQPEERALLDLFLRSRGNVKDVERGLGLSYPTVRARLDQLWARLGYRAAPETPTESPEEILASLRDGRIDVTQAEERLRQATTTRSRAGG